MPRRLTARDITTLRPKQARFLDEWMLDFNPGKAAVRAGYKSPAAAFPLMRNPVILAELRQRKRQIVKAANLDGTKLLERYRDIAFADVRDAFDADGNLKKLSEIDDDTMSALVIEAETRKSGGKRTTVKRVKQLDPLAALDAIARHIDFFPRPQNQINVNVGVAIGVKLEQLRHRIRIVDAEKTPATPTSATPSEAAPAS